MGWMAQGSGFVLASSYESERSLAFFCQIFVENTQGNNFLPILPTIKHQSFFCLKAFCVKTKDLLGNRQVSKPRAVQCSRPSFDSVAFLHQRHLKTTEHKKKPRQTSIKTKKTQVNPSSTIRFSGFFLIPKFLKVGGGIPEWRNKKKN